MVEILIYDLVENIKGFREKVVRIKNLVSGDKPFLFAVSGKKQFSSPPIKPGDPVPDLKNKKE